MAWSAVSLSVSSISSVSSVSAVSVAFPTAAAGSTGANRATGALSSEGEQRERQLLHRVNGCLMSGEILSVLGPSGSGKSTLLRVLNRLFPIDGGKIQFKEQPLESWPVTELRRRVSFIAQQPAFFPGTAEENLTYGTRLWNLPCDPVRLMKTVRLEADLLRQPVDTLSGGQQQRLALARSLALDPDVLLLDEPTSALDIHTTREIEEMVTALAGRERKGVIWVTHDPEQARRVSQRLLLLDEGHVIADLPKDAFFSDKAGAGVRSFLAISDGSNGGKEVEK
ncbi:ATP-binding cassette domain-containing protein [Heliobacterium undosum]|uniref:ATP-binding cassette domain-containing protein n=1 Tax=Heliomicrobium undosum TaxID=121734 RepID=A0A845L4J7_9FIRM|nr:ATP-binding cassette domain-containing protein [Heliomicrobium undosum]MZP31223.1 ATP-binding cassette domain-containing protein [Heliomicrobium undosum]